MNVARKHPFILTVTEIVVTALFCATHLSSCQPRNQIKTVCVIAVDNTTECSILSHIFNCSVCQTLSFYFQNVSNCLTSNMKMVFTMGNHCLITPSDGSAPLLVNLTGVSNFSMIGLGNISYNPSEEGSVHPSSVITCSCSQNKRLSAILFYKSNTIRIENLTIEDCGAEVVLPNPPKTNFTTESALIFSESYDIELVRICMNGNIEFGMFANQVFGNFIILNSAFLRCMPITLKKKQILVQMH